jgi:hypothetical protein
MEIENFCDREKEIALLHIFEAVLASKAILLGDARKAEGLARETSAEYFKRLDFLDRHLSDVIVWDFVKVGLVRLSGKLVPIARENTLAARALKCEAKSTYSAK